MKLCNFVFQILRSEGSLQRWITSITEISENHLTPEIKLHLITPRCSLWHEPPDKCPFPDPFWAFYWPGGQGITKFILENKSLFKNKNVLDVGCGCGASSIACLYQGANKVVANDIDPNALQAVKMNIALNIYNTAVYSTNLSTDSWDLSSTNFLTLQRQELMRLLDVGMEKKFDVVLLGDMFYDEDMVDLVFQWLRSVSELLPKVKIFLGDPGRGFLKNHPIFEQLKTFVEYDLPSNVMEEHYGHNSVSVLEFTTA